MGTLVANLRREPLLHFLILAAVFLGADAWLSGRHKDTIVVDQGAIAAMVEERTQVLGRPPTEAERAEMIATFVEQEILVREAARRGLDRDGFVRQHLADKMYLILRDPIPEPGDAELRAYYEANRDAYRQPAVVTLDRAIYADATEVPANLLDQLRTNSAEESDRTAEAVPTERTLWISQFELGLLVGDALAATIFALPEGEWHGPFTTIDGTEFIRVVERTSEQLPDFDEAARYLAQDWTMAAERASIEAKLDALRADYAIIVDDGGNAPLREEPGE